MPRFLYQPWHLTFLRHGYPLMSLGQLTRAFNRQFGLQKTEREIKAALSNHGIKCGRKLGEMNKGKRSLLTSEQAAWLRDQYRHISRAELTASLNERFGLSLRVSQVVAYCKNHGITSGRSGCFEKGLRPWNKGTKGIMPGSHTSFGKGHVPANLRDIGEERLDSRDGYLIVKTAAINPHTGFFGWWRHKHVVVWEEAHGPVPEGHVVTFINGDILDVRLENLEMISRAEHVRRNKLRLRELPEELKPTARLLAKVQMKAGERLKEMKG